MTQKDYRKEIYSFVRENGFNMTTLNQGTLSCMLKKLCKMSNEDMNIVNNNLITKNKLLKEEIELLKKRKKVKNKSN